MLRRVALSSSALALGLLVNTAAAGSKPILITVDDLPITPGSLHGEREDRDAITERLLAALAEHDIQAAGFVTWRNVRDEADRKLLERWIAAGHELGNHSRDHLNLTRTGAEDYIADLEHARAKIAELLAEHDRELRLFRFPFLREGETRAKLDAVRAYLRDSGQTNLCPTLDTQDWSFERPWVEARRAGDEPAMAVVADQYLRSLKLSIESQERLSERLFERADVPQVLLLHANEVGSANWPALFDWLIATGHRFATPDEVLADPAYATGHDYVGDYGPGLWHRIFSEQTVVEARAEIEKLLEEQIGQWNRGDIDSFVSVYAEDAVFLSPSGLNSGRAEVLARYKKRYPDRAAMGQLALEILEFRPAHGTEVSMLGDAVPSRVHGATVAARWKLTYPDGEPKSGLTLIVFRRVAREWVIVQDASM